MWISLYIKKWKIRIFYIQNNIKSIYKNKKQKLKKIKLYIINEFWLNNEKNTTRKDIFLESFEIIGQKASNNKWQKKQNINLA